MKYKVGDKVKVIQNSDSETQERYSSWVGKTYTITELEKERWNRLKASLL